MALDVQQFEAQRPLLFGIAYRMLGSASEAEDAVQDAYLRAMAAPGDEIRVPRAFLSTVLYLIIKTSPLNHRLRPEV